MAKKVIMHHLLPKDKDNVVVNCRLCGEPWKIPPYMAKELGPDKGYECPYCKRGIKQN